VRVDALLCDYVQASENKLFVNGGGISRSWVAAQPPHMIKVGVAAMVHVPYLETNQAHTITVSLVTEDGHPVIPYFPEGMPGPSSVEISAQFNVGRPPTIVPGETQTWPLAANFELGLRELGGYKFVVSVDGKESTDLALRVAVQPPGVATFRPQASAL
jgi:hypothetical protein